MASAPHLVSVGGTASLLGSALGGYQVQGLIGRGAMGSVYLARDTALNRPVALKVLLGSLARNPSMVRNFHREAQAAAPLRHPCIVQIFSAGVESGTPYIAMEYVPGEPLDRFLRRKGKVPWQTALYIAAQLAGALECAHAAGVIHRDVKPANILLDRQGRVRLTDFGIARMASVDHGAEPLGGVIGTPTYMSPEQCEGGDVSASTDLYSLGVVLFQMIAGRPPFAAASPQALVKQILTDEPPRLNKLMPQVPDDVARLVAHLMAKDPEKRPLTAWQVCRMIQRLQAEDGGHSAIPEALAAFVREQASENSLRLITPAPNRGRKQDRADASVTPTEVLREPFHFKAAVFFCAVTALGLLMAAGAWTQGSGTRPALAAPALDRCIFSEGEVGRLTAQVSSPGFQFTRLRWAGRQLVAEASGRAGTLTQGTTGLLGFDPEARVCTSIHAPATLANASGNGPLALPLAYRVAGPDGHGPLSGAMLMEACVEDETPGSTRVYIYPQSISDALPGEVPAATLRAVTSPGFTMAAAVPHPDGHTLCLLIQNPDGTGFLVERNVRWRDPERVGPALTPRDSRLVPGSIQYDPPGQRLAYLRMGRNGNSELWVTTSHTESRSNTLLAVGDISPDFAFSPDGAVVAIAGTADPAQAPQVRLVDTATGKQIGRPVDGLPGPECWLPSGGAFVVTRIQPGKPARLWLVSAKPPFDARPFVSLPDGEPGPPAVSPDGRWVAVCINGDRESSVVFVPLETRQSDPTTDVHGGRSAS